MPNRVFVDTVFVIALINPRDRYHREASQLADRLDGHPLLVTDAVLLEIGNGLARGYRREAAAIIEYFFASPEVEVVPLTPQLFSRAFDLYRDHQDKEWGLVDCISFVVMREAMVGEALTFDRHFAQAGFQVLMQEAPSR